MLSGQRKTTDHVDLLKEQLKILSGEVALHTSVLKRLTEETTRSTNEIIEVICPCAFFQLFEAIFFNILLQVFLFH